MRKLITLIMAVLMAFGAFAFVGCGGGGQPSESVNDEMSQLNIGIFDAGLGTVWLDETIDEFEELYANVSFEDGKKGVQVWKDHKKEQFRPGNLMQTMPEYDNALYYLDQFNYNEYISKGLISDITEVIQEKCFDEDGNWAFATGKPAVKTIEDTMAYDLDKSFKKGDKYYGIPYYYMPTGMIYDADLFNTRGLYMFKNNQFGAKQADIDAGLCSVGPDGVPNTTDDGMPNTWNDFIRLMNYMVSADVIPFTWDGQNLYQLKYAFNQIYANYEGANNYLLNFSFDGYDTGLELQISESNKRQLFNQEGRVAAIKAMYDIEANEKYYSAKALTQGHTEAQFEYVWSKNDDMPIAMFTEGGYWESEARAVFDEMAIVDKADGYGQRDFRLLPVPRFTNVLGVKAQTNTQRVVVGASAGIVCISAKNKCENPTVQRELAELFLQFAQSREQLVDFTKNTGACFRPFTYTTKPEEIKTYTKFAQSVLNQINEGGALALEVDLSEDRINNASKYNDGTDPWNFYARRGDEVRCYEPFSYFRKYSGASVSDCLNDMLNTSNAFFD